MCVVFLCVYFLVNIICTIPQVAVVETADIPGYKGSAPTHVFVNEEMVASKSKTKALEAQIAKVCWFVVFTSFTHLNGSVAQGCTCCSATGA